MPHDTALPHFVQRSLPTIDAGQVLAPIPRPPQGAAVRSLYIHIPFCFHKCHYCDFYSIVDNRDRQEAFTDRLITELGALAPWAAGFPLSTIFVGGGTPTLLRPALWTRLLEALGRDFDLTDIRTGIGEFTVECNPETLTPDLLHLLKAGGVTRVSVGAQSFEAKHLKTLERWHDPANVIRAIELARAAGINRQSIDLIYAVPGQTLEEWDADLTRALSLGTEHMSCYSLTYEPNTAMTARLKRGEFIPAPEDLEAEMFEHTLRRLRAAGLDRYEVSNFAKPGAECRHNMAYWRQNSWLAAGPSASAHAAGRRWKNLARLDDYLERHREGFSLVTDVEYEDASRALAERLMTGLRLSEGLNAAEMLERAKPLGEVKVEKLRRVAERAARNGLLDAPSLARSHWVLTDQGFLVADSIALDFMSALD